MLIILLPAQKSFFPLKISLKMRPAALPRSAASNLRALTTVGASEPMATLISSITFPSLLTVRAAAALAMEMDIALRLPSFRKAEPPNGGFFGFPHPRFLRLMMIR
jgi:hypothetical protein